MPTKKKTGRRRLEIIAEPEWIDLLTDAAKDAGHASLSSYIRVTMNAQMRKQGFYPGEAAKGRGRPKGENADSDGGQKK